MQYSNYDLHCHSNMSDGDLEPKDVVVRAKDNGVEVLALTDHDTIEGLEEASREAQLLGVRLINGIELSCQWGGHTIHVLGLNFDVSDGRMKAAQERQLNVRRERAEIITQKLIRKGLPDVLARAREIARSGVPGRPHFAQALQESGAVKDHQEAFRKFLGSGKVGDVQTGWPMLSDVTDWILGSKGTAVLAHPRKYSMSLTKLRQLIEEFGDVGGQGLEVVVSGHKQGEIGMLGDLCRRYKMQASVGSDFHSPRFPWADLGRVPPLPQGLEPVWSDWG